MADECHGALDLPTESLDFTHGFSWTLHYMILAFIEKHAAYISALKDGALRRN